MLVAQICLQMRHCIIYIVKYFKKGDGIMEEKEDYSIYLDDRGLDDGTFLKNVVKEALDYKEKREDDEN